MTVNTNIEQLVAAILDQVKPDVPKDDPRLMKTVVLGSHLLVNVLVDIKRTADALEHIGDVLNNISDALKNIRA